MGSVSLKLYERFLAEKERKVLPFSELVETKKMAVLPLPQSFFGLLGISKSRDRSFWVQLSTLAPGPTYRGEPFYKRFKLTGLVRIFDPVLFISWHLLVWQVMSF